MDYSGHEMKHRTMKKHDGGHAAYGNFEHEAAMAGHEKEGHEVNRKIVSHQEHQEGHMVHRIHHFGSAGHATKS